MMLSFYQPMMTTMAPITKDAHRAAKRIARASGMKLTRVISAAVEHLDGLEPSERAAALIPSRDGAAEATARSSQVHDHTFTSHGPKGGNPRGRARQDVRSPSVAAN